MPDTVKDGLSQSLVEHIKEIEKNIPFLGSTEENQSKYKIHRNMAENTNPLDNKTTSRKKGQMVTQQMEILKLQIKYL